MRHLEFGISYLGKSKGKSQRAKVKNQRFQSLKPKSQAEAEAHQILVEIYNWFTGGFDTKDLQEAKGLLEKLEYSV